MGQYVGSISDCPERSSLGAERLLQELLDPLP